MDNKQYAKLKEFLKGEVAFYVIAITKFSPKTENKKLLIDSLKLLGEQTFFRINTNVASSGALAFQSVPKRNKSNSVIVKVRTMELLTNELGLNLQCLLFTKDVLWFPTSYVNQKCTAMKVARRNKRIKAESQNIINVKRDTPDSLIAWTKKTKKELDKKTTKSERSLLGALQNTFKKRVKSQQPFVIGGKVYYADICIKSLKTIIEVDGGYHDTPEQREKDAIRDAAFKSIGYTTIRVQNDKAESRNGKKEVVETLLRKDEELKNKRLTFINKDLC